MCPDLWIFHHTPPPRKRRYRFQSTHLCVCFLLPWVCTAQVLAYLQLRIFLEWPWDRWAECLAEVSGRCPAQLPKGVGAGHKGLAQRSSRTLESGHTRAGSPLRTSELIPCVERGASWPGTAKPVNLTSFTGHLQGAKWHGGTLTNMEHLVPSFRGSQSSREGCQNPHYTRSLRVVTCSRFGRRC